MRAPEGCAIRDRNVWISANAVLAFDTWSSLGEEYAYSPFNDPGSHPVVDVFLALGR